MVDPLLSTSSTVHTYHTLASVSVDIPPAISGGNSSSIWEKPVPYSRPISTSKKTMMATSSEVSHTEQGIIPFTNVLQGHTTVVQVGCIVE